MAGHAFELHGGGWAHIRLEDIPSFAALHGELERLRLEEASRCVVLSGNTFPAEDAPPSGSPLPWLELFELPTIFAFSGLLHGLAFDVAIACDIRVCGGESAIQATSIGHARLVRLIPTPVSVELLRSRGRMEAESALDCGLVSHVAREEPPLDYAARLAETIASRGPIATKLAKEAIWRGLDLPFHHALRFETDLTLLLQTTKDRAEGVRAFLEKRPPKFTGE